nr:gamma-glutamyltransferase [Polycladospora coralii]
MIVAYVWNQKQTQTSNLEKVFTTDSDTNQKYGVAAAHPEAVKVGMEILQEGGNAVDAAVAVSYALGVVEPFGSGIGGGGTMLVHPNKEGEDPVVFDYRETASYEKSASHNGIGTPGLVKGMELAHQKLGLLGREKLIQPSIQLAEEGFEVTRMLSSRLRDSQWRLPVNSLPHFYPEGAPLKEGDLLVQHDLAETLRAIQKNGEHVFYNGAIAQHIEDQSNAVFVSDLKRYQAMQKKPIVLPYHNYTMYATEPPGGGVMLAQSLQMSERMGISEKKVLSADYIHLLGEIGKRVNASRIKNMGDTHFVDVPVEQMLSTQYTNQLAADIDLGSRSDTYKEFVDSLADQENHDNTTHFVIVDRNGMMVSVTNTLSNFFGSGVYVDGFFLNNQLKNFSINNQSPNRFEQGKKSLSYTAPTIFSENGKPVLGIGSAGGNRITPVLTQVIIGALASDQSLQTVLDRTRFIVKDHLIYVEEDLPDKVKQELEKMGYVIELRPTSLYYGGVQAIRVDHEKNVIEGGYDKRRDGAFQFSQ